MCLIILTIWRTLAGHGQARAAATQQKYIMSVGHKSMVTKAHKAQAQNAP